MGLIEKWSGFISALNEGVFRNDDPFNHGVKHEAKVYLFQKINKKSGEHFIEEEYFLVRIVIPTPTTEKNLHFETNMIYPIRLPFSESCSKEMKNCYKLMIQTIFSEDIALDDQIKMKYDKLPENEDVKVLKAEFTVIDNELFFSEKLTVSGKKIDPLPPTLFSSSTKVVVFHCPSW